MSVLYCSSLFGASFAASCKVSDVVVFVTAQKDQLVAEVEGVRRTSIGVLPVMRKSTWLCRGLGPVRCLALRIAIAEARVCVRKAGGWGQMPGDERDIDSREYEPWLTSLLEGRDFVRLALPRDKLLEGRPTGLPSRDSCH